MINIIMVFAQLERENIAMRVKDNYHFRSTQGIFMGGNVPFGYSSKKEMVNGKSSAVLETNEDAETVKLIFEMFINYKKAYTVCVKLNEDGIKTPNGSYWSRKRVLDILNNISPVANDNNMYQYLKLKGYKINNKEEEFDGKHGLILFFKYKDKNKKTDLKEQTVVIGQHSPFISSKIFIQCQRIIQGTERHVSRGSARSFLAGLVFCDKCNYSFGLKSLKRNSTLYQYYFCRGRADRHTKCDNKSFIQASELENIVLFEIRKHIGEIDIKSTTKKKEVISPTRKEIDEISIKIERYVNAIGENDEKDIVKALKAKIESLITKKNQLQQSLSTQIMSGSIPTSKISEIKKVLSSFDKLSIEDKSLLVRSIVNKIFVEDSKNKKIRIIYKF